MTRANRLPVARAVLGAATALCVAACGDYHAADRSAQEAQAGGSPSAVAAGGASASAAANARDAAIAPSAQGGAAGVDPGDVVARVDAGAAPDAASPWCCLEGDLKWQHHAWGYLPHYFRLTKDGTLERRPVVDEREQGTPYVGSAEDLADAGIAAPPPAIALPPCGQGKICLRDVRDALADPDVAAVLPDGHDFPNNIVLDGTVFYMFVGDTQISFGLPPLPDLPAGFKTLHALLERLELEHLQASLPSCSAAAWPSTDCSRSTAPGCVNSWYLGGLIELADCAAAERCERDARARVGYSTDDVECVCAVVGVCETPDAGH